MAALTPEDIEGRSFRTGFRGYDPLEVREFLDRVSRLVRELTEERDRLAAQVGPGRDLAAEIDAIVAEVGEVLHAARAAAESIRSEALADAARWRDEATAAAEQERAGVAEEVERAREAAAAEVEVVLADAVRRREQVVSDAEQEALKLVGDAEREAHRRLTAARKDSEDLLRVARTEADRLIAEAQARHDDIIAAAQRLVETSQDRARALEARRDELRREVEEMRRLLGGSEEEPSVEEPVAEEHDEPAPVAPAPDPEEPAWEPGGTVRVVRPAADARRSVESRGVPVEPGEEPEVRVIPPDELARRREEGVLVPDELPTVETVGGVDALERPEPGEPSPAEPEDVAALPETDPGETEPEASRGETGPGEGTGSAAVEESEDAEDEAEPGEGPEAPAADVAGLFARLRSGAPPPAASPEEDRPGGEEAGGALHGEEPAAAGEAPHGDEEAGSAHGEETPTGTPAAAVLDIDPFEMRDRLLLPIANRALRNLKRQLTEEQNSALEAVRLDEGGWEPNAEELAGSLRADLVVLVSESYAAGHSAAEEMLRARIRRLPTPAFDVVGPIAAALAEDVAAVLHEGRALGQGARQLAAGVSRVFRGWRADEAERRVRDWSFTAYHTGLVDSLRESDVGDLRWIVAGRGCASCRAAAERPVAGLPPAHGDCACTVLPALPV